jgi:hypothetical protein
MIICQAIKSGQTLKKQVLARPDVWCISSLLTMGIVEIVIDVCMNYVCSTCFLQLNTGWEVLYAFFHSNNSTGIAILQPEWNL